MRKFIYILIFLCFFLKLNAQKIYIEADNQSLNQIFIELQNTYGVQFSFDDKLLSNCIVSKTQTYDSAEKAISDLIKTCNLDYEIINNVFIIYPKKRLKTKLKSKYYYFSCHILDKINQESLAFSNVQFNSNGLSADVTGHFLFKTKDSIVNLKISHIGYYLLDTIIAYGENQNLKLTPFIHDLQEVDVVFNKQKILKHHYFSHKSGFIKINHKVASFLPGNSNNTIFNILRLQSGILATGELSNDFIIWGSYKGQTLVLFDGITLFSLSSFDDDIGAINPLIIKDLEVKKGGYNVGFGNRVGGVVNITSKSGNTNNFLGELNINNETINGTLNIPIAKKYALQTSFRKTFYNIFEDKNKTDETEKSSYTPNYEYQDMNVKFSNKNTKNSHFYISLFGSNDKFSFHKKQYNKEFSKLHDTEKKQLGAVLFYHKEWKSIGMTNTKISYSDLVTDTYDSLSHHIKGYNFNKSFSEINKTKNGISEVSINLEHFFPNKNNNSFIFGIGSIYNISNFKKNDFKVPIQNSNETSFRTNYYIKDEINLFDKMFISAGLRLDFLNKKNKAYFQPRLNGSFKTSKKTKINFAFGVYNQFIKENAIIDNLENYLYYWNICDDEYISVLNSKHYVLGFSFQDEKINFKLESFYKKINGLNHLITRKEDNFLQLVEGENRTYGIDFYIKKDIKKHEFFFTYTLSKTEEYFPNFIEDEFKNAPHDQRHEIKLAGIFNIYPFFVSVNYIYGSGLSSSAFFTEDRKIIPYKRFDIAVLYQVIFKDFKLKTGLSLINVFDTENVSYNNSARLSENRTIYSKAMPFTPTLFLNFSF